MDKRVQYIPSLEAGAFGNRCENAGTLPNGTPFRWWSSDKYKNLAKGFLISAGTSYKKPEHALKYNFSKDMTVFGDSGGFQIATGVLKYDPEIVSTILTWLETNSTVAMNLDIPTKGLYAGKFDECLTLSLRNFRYFADHRTGKCDLLNVLQGTTYEEYSAWYRNVSEFEFDGWAIGGGRSVYKLLSAVTVLLQNKELSGNKKWLHILGISKIHDFFFLSKLQKELNEIGSDVQITTDSSSPGKSSAYGYWYTHYDLTNGTFKYIKIPREKDLEYSLSNVTNFPILVDIDKDIWESFDLVNIYKEHKTVHYAAVAYHNLFFFIKAFNEIAEYAFNSEYFASQLLPSDISRIYHSISELVKSSDPEKIFKKYEPLYKAYDRKISSSDNNDHASTFFDII